MTARTARRAVGTLLLGPRPRPHDFLPPLRGSGGHFNPAVSLAAALIGGLDLTMLLPYWASQLCGGLVGAALAKVGDPGGWAAAGLRRASRPLQGDLQRAFGSLHTRPALSVSGRGLPGTDREAAFGTQGSLPPSPFPALARICSCSVPLARRLPHSAGTSLSTDWGAGRPAFPGPTSVSPAAPLYSHALPSLGVKIQSARGAPPPRRDGQLFPPASLHSSAPHTHRLPCPSLPPPLPPSPLSVFPAVCQSQSW